MVLCTLGVSRGHAGAKELAQRLQQELPDARFAYRTVLLVDGEPAFLEWTAESAAGRVRDGADSFLIRDGRITGQTIHCTIERWQHPPHRKPKGLRRRWFQPFRLGFR